MKKIVLATYMALLAVVLLPPTASDPREQIIPIYVGPYLVMFNDSHTMYIQTDMPGASFCGDLEKPRGLFNIYSASGGTWDHLYYIKIDISEDIRGSESCLMNKSDIYMVPGLKPQDIQVLEQRDRLIDGHKGVVMVVKSSMGYGYSGLLYSTSISNITQHCIFWMKVPISCGGSVVQARVDIEACNYTEKEFDRLLDTFSIERYVSRGDVT